MRNEALRYSKDVEKYIGEGIRGGVGIRDIIAGMQHLQDAPKSLSTMYKIYGDFIFATRNELNARVGSKVIDQALEGDFKSQELFLRSKAGWSPQNTVNEVESDGDEETDESAVQLLMAMLKKD